MKHRLFAGLVALGIALNAATVSAIAGSVLVSNPQWQFIGPQSIQGVQARFGRITVNPPFAATGRVTAIATDPTAQGRLFVGTAGGGVWMTTDSGNTFTQITLLLDPSTIGQSFPQRTVGALALNATTTPPTIYLGTGEGNRGDSFWGEGLFSSTNLGASWASIASSVKITSGQSFSASHEEEGFTKLAVDTSHSPPYVYAAAVPEYGVNRAGLSPLIAQTYPGFWGLWRSIDGGATFTQYAPSALGGCISMNDAVAPCPADDVVIDPLTNTVFAAVDGYGVFVSNDSGNTWSPAMLPGITNGQGVGRISLVASDGVAYAMVGSSSAQLTYLGLFKFSGSSWQVEKVPCQQLVFGDVSDVIDGTSNGAGSNCGLASTYSQSSFDQALAIQPGTQGTGVAFGGVGLYYSADSGNTWVFLSNNSTGSIHEDVHAIAFDPFNSKTLYAGTDGGLFEANLSTGTPTISTLNGTSPNSIVSTEMYSVAPHVIGSSNPATDAETFLAGLQDNGVTLSAPSPTAQPTPSLQWSVTDPAAGDSSFVLYDSQDSTRAYHDNLTFNLKPSASFSTDSGASWTESFPPLDQNLPDFGSIPFPGLADDPSVSQYLLFGSFHIYSSTNGMVSWSQQTAQDLTRGCEFVEPPGIASSAPCGVHDIGFAPSDDARGYAVTGNVTVWSGNAPGGFYVWTTTQANQSIGASWSEITGSLRNSNHEQSSVLQASSVTTDPNAGENVYLGLQCSPLLLGNCASSLYEATANGSSTTWTGVDGRQGSGANPINSPVYKVLVDNTDPTSKHLLAGTAGGLFMSKDGGANWNPYGAGGAVPNVPVLDLEQNSAGQIFVATHGAGAYKLSVPTFVGHTNTEVAENGCGHGNILSCNISVSPPAGAQPGDVFLVLFQAVVNDQACVESVVSNQSGWTELPFATNGQCSNQLVISGDGNIFVGTWVYAHVLTANDPATYSFTFNNLGGNGFASEGDAYLVSYRGASQDFSTYTLYGWPGLADSMTVKIPQDTNIPSNATLVNIFEAGENDNNEDNNISVTFSVPTGSPALTLQTSRSVVWSDLVGDVFTGPTGGTFGGYSTSDGVNSVNTGIQIVVPPL